MNLARELLNLLIQHGGSDLHLSCGSPPILRVDGSLCPLDVPALVAADLDHVLQEVLGAEQLSRFRATRELDFVVDFPEVGRLRGNAFLHQRGSSVVFRLIPSAVPTAEELGLPEVVLEFAQLKKGLILFTGPAGAGKSTTLAALIDRINQTRADHIITIEDPIEFVHANKRSLVNQREVGVHTASFASALRAALREDPDVILVGEMRDAETMAIGLTAAETGHLVLGTLHTTGAHSTIDRIIDSFPPEQQGQARSMLAESLHAVVAQQLLRRSDGNGRVLALEVLVNTPAVANLIREGKTFQIPSLIQTSRRSGMMLMDQSIADHLAAGRIDLDEALACAQDPAFFTTRADL